MNNQPPLLVTHDQYEQARSYIVRQRMALDITEQRLAEGLKFNEDLEEFERTLVKRVQDGEEARQQLEMLRRKKRSMMLTSDRLALPDARTLLPAAPPSTSQAPSDSAYIEEMPVQGQQHSSHYSSPVYSHSARNFTRPPQASNYNQQRQPVSNVGSHVHTQRNPEVSRSMPTQSQPPQRSVQSTITPSPQIQEYQRSIPTSQHYRPQITPHAIHPSQQTQAYPQAQVTQAMPFTPEQMQQARQHFQQRYYPNVPYYQPTPDRVPTPPQQAQVPQTQVNSWQRQGAPRPSTSTANLQVQNHTQETVEKQNQAQLSNGAAVSTVIGRVNTPSSDGALGPAPSAKTQVPVSAVSDSHPVAAPTPLPLASSGSSTANVIQEASTRNNRSPTPPDVPTTSDTGQPTTMPSAIVSSPPPSSSVAGASSVTKSPMRTPKQVDKKHLARDLLRALKRPRPETSSSTTSEPEAKRHAPEHAIQPALLQPTPTTPPVNIPLAIPSTSTKPLRAPVPTTLPVLPPAKTATPSHPLRFAELPVNQTTPPTATQPVQSAQQAAAPTNLLTSTSPTLSGTPQIVSKPIATVSQSGPPVSTENSRAAVPASLPSNGFNIAVTSPGSSKPQTSSNTTNLTNLLVVPQVPTVEPPKPLPTIDSSIGKPLKFLVYEPKDTPATPAIVEGVPKSLVTGPSTTLRWKTTVDDAMAAEVTSELSLPGNATKTTPNVFPPPQKTPLFLPSPTASPNPDSTSQVLSLSPLTVRDKGKGKADTTATASPPSSSATGPVAGKRSSRPNMVFAYVLAPPLPEYVRRWKAQRTRPKKSALEDELDTIGHRRRSRVEERLRSPSLGDFPAQSPSTPAVSVDIVDLVGDDEESGTEDSATSLIFTSYDDAEKQVLYEHCSRLRECHCRWLDCEVLLNTPGTLLKHLNAEHGPRKVNAESPWTCQWTGCGYTVISRDDYRQHVERHAVFPLWCPYRDCNENFRTPRQLIKHKRNDHGSAAVLRPTPQPSTVSTKSMPLAPHIPKILPWYVFEYKVVRPASISKQRHETLMPSILRRISGNVPLQLQRYNAARPMPMTPSGSLVEEPANHPYSFLEHRSTRYSSYLSTPAKSKNIQDLDSGRVTNLAKRGLVLWPEKESEEAVPEAMIMELERMEEDMVERELLDEDGFDVFGPTVAINPSDNEESETDGHVPSDRIVAKADPGEELSAERVLMQVPTS